MFDFATSAFPEFAEFMKDDPEWYKCEMDYGVARRFLDFAVSLRSSGDVAELQRLMAHVESGLQRPDLTGPLCLDFVQPIADLYEYQAEFVALLGPSSKRCFNEQ